MNKSILVFGIVVLASMPFLAGYSSDSVSKATQVSSPEVSSADVDQDTIERLADILATVSAQVPILTIRNSSMTDVFEVVLSNEQVLYVNAEGTHFVVGDLYGLVDGELANLSDSAKDIARVAFNKTRKEEIDKLDPSGFIVFPATIEKVATVTIFTDVDCPYCRKLHADMAGYNSMGIEVRYAAFPRAGVGSKAYKNMVSAWCAEDRNTAIDSLKRMKSIQQATCGKSVV